MITRSAPARASALPRYCPNPRLAPVTTAVFPERSNAAVVIVDPSYGSKTTFIKPGSLACSRSACLDSHQDPVGLQLRLHLPSARAGPGHEAAGQGSPSTRAPIQEKIIYYIGQVQLQGVSVPSVICEGRSLRNEGTSPACECVAQAAILHPGDIWPTRQVVHRQELTN